MPNNAFQLGKSIIRPYLGIHTFGDFLAVVTHCPFQLIGQFLERDDLDASIPPDVDWRILGHAVAIYDARSRHEFFGEFLGLLDHASTRRGRRCRNWNAREYPFRRAEKAVHGIGADFICFLLRIKQTRLEMVACIVCQCHIAFRSLAELGQIFQESRDDTYHILSELEHRIADLDFMVLDTFEIIVLFV